MIATGACTRQPPVPLDTLVVALGSQPATLDPRHATDANGVRISALIFDGLVRLGPDLEPIPEAAERWERHGRSLTFYLRRDLRFHNGRALNKDDVTFSFARALAPDSTFSSLRDLVETVAVEESARLGQIVVKITLRSASDKFLKSDLAILKLLPKTESEQGDYLLGTGPFRFVRQTANEIELDGVRAASRHLRFKVIRDDFTRYQKMLKGEVDIAQMEISPDRVVDFQKRPESFQVFLYPGLAMTYLLINFKDPLLRQFAVRAALAESIERGDLIRFKLYGRAREATSILTPQNSYFNSALRNPPLDLADARAKIAALNLHGHELTLKTSNTPQAVDNGKVLAYQMSRSGLKVEVQSFEWGTFYNDVKHGQFQLALMRWVGSADPDIYRLAFHSHEKLPGRNRGSYFNPELDAELDSVAHLDDLNQRKQVYNEVQARVQRDLAIIPLWYDEQIAIAKQNVTGYHPNQTGDFRPLTEARKQHD